MCIRDRAKNAVLEKYTDAQERLDKAAALLGRVCLLYTSLLCGKVGEGKGKVEHTALAAGILFEHPAHFLQGDFIIAQDVAFTLAALVGGGNGGCDLIKAAALLGLSLIHI